MKAYLPRVPANQSPCPYRPARRPPPVPFANIYVLAIVVYTSTCARLTRRNPRRSHLAPWHEVGPLRDGKPVFIFFASRDKFATKYAKDTTSQRDVCARVRRVCVRTHEADYSGIDYRSDSNARTLHERRRSLFATIP